MRRLRRFLPWLGLALILLTATRVRWLSYALPSVPSEASDFFRDDHGDPYFADPDSYYYLRKAEELAGAGGSLLSEARESDRLIGGRQAESAGSHGTLMGLPALTYLVWRLLSLFSALSLSQLALRLAPVVSALSALPPFLFLRKRAGAVPALTAAALAAFAVPFASHACVGFFDTDMVLGVLPLAVMLSFLRCLEEENVRKQLGFALLSASALALMSLFWQFYSLYLALPLCCGVFCLLFSALERGLRRRHRGLPSAGSGPLRRMARGWLFCAGLMGGFLLMLHGPGLFSSLAGIAQLASGALGASGADSAFLPDPSRYVVEMQPVPPFPSPGGGIAEWIVAGRSSLLSLLGGLPVCLAVLLSVPAEAAAIRLGRKTSSEGTVLAFLAAWLLATLPPALAHHRFAQLAVLPAAVLAGLFVARVGDLLGRLRLPRAGRALLSALLALGLAAPVLWGARSLIRGILPTVTDARASAMSFIRRSLPENTAVASWWDDGYYTEYAARRRSLADGGTYSGTVNFLLSRALLSEDPGLTRGIFRMLENAGDGAVRLLTGAGCPERDALALLLRLLPRERSEAEALLQNEKSLPLTASERQELLGLTHPEETRPLALVLGTDLFARIRLLADYGLREAESRPASGVFCVRSARSEPIPGSGQTSELSFRDSAWRLVWTDRGESPAGLALFFGDRENPIGRLRVYRQGHLIRREDAGSGPAVVLLLEENRWCAAVMSDRLCDTVLIRLLMCEDADLPGFVKLGAWFGPATDPSEAQRRMSSWNMLSWCTQVFAVLE